MSTKDDGGPAFPRDYRSGGNDGMSLRDWFAGMAMQGMVMRYGQLDNNGAYGYKIADSMLAERKK